MAERINSSAFEVGGSERQNGYDSLAQQNEGFDAKKARALIESEESRRTESSIAETESPESSRIKARIEERLSQKTLPEGTENNQNAKDAQNEKEQPQAKQDFVSRKYALHERYYIDGIKRLLTPENISDFKKRQITTRPSTFTKIVRMVTDAFGIKPPKSGPRRFGEAIPAAIAEFQAEELKKSEKKSEKKRMELLAEDMASAREGLENRRKERLEKQRIQEVIEKDLNKRILNVDQLEELSLMEGSGVEKDSVLFEGSEIPIYTLKGLPTSILATTIDYKLKSGENALGSGMAKKVMEDPSLWLKPRHVVEEEGEVDKYGEKHEKAAGNTICAWYVNLERNLDGIISGNLIYGLGPVDGDSILKIFIGDGDTPNTMGKSKTGLSKSSLNILDRIEGPKDNGYYSEITLRRYNEEGAPKRPSFIVTLDGKMNDYSLRHAKFFTVPIVNIERSSYWEKAQEMSNQIIDSISEDDSYDELIGKIQNLQSIGLNQNGIYKEITSIGRAVDAYPILKSSISNPRTYSEKLAKLSGTEFMKRLEFIDAILREATKKIEQATRNGVPVSPVPSQFSEFNVRLYDYRHKREVDARGERDYWSNETCNHIVIEFKLKGTLKKIETTIYDEDDSEPNKYLADNEPYRHLEYLVERYIGAVRENNMAKKG